jgi:hypothetical protein
METVYWSPSFFGKYTNGVLSTNFEIGTFLTIQNGADCFFSSQLFYKINRLKLENTAIYQTQVILGSNRQNSIGDRLTINEKYGIQGFNSAVYGNKFIMTLQTQGYAPKDIWGLE